MRDSSIHQSSYGDRTRKVKLPNYNKAIGLYGAASRRQSKFDIQDLQKQLGREVDPQRAKWLAQKIKTMQRELDEDYEACRQDEAIKNAQKR